ncbi:hypothetical protein [Sphingomonas sp. Leaf25]|uniref:hypothetical protein n=1 Tax=Sphingomonas sp. Leaf25 TaxID=1735692 RepID=UPI0006FDB2DD|nr:hypothetical protein [Sphingomonas sp. Leaf25]KQN03984.1 hypothetical protein ASE78_02785 [Sphingomonas sp. Leaf25]
MNELLDRVRETALLLPGAAEQGDGDDHAFCVEGEPFARADGDALSVRTADGWTPVSVEGDVDWRLVEDAIARGWELTAPRDLLEAGGR